MNNSDATSVRIRAMSVSDSKAVSHLIVSLFDEFIAPGYSKKASRTFRRQTRLQLRRLELDPGERRLVAVSNGEPIGVIGVRDVSHVHWLWVRKDWHRRGVARNLMTHAIAEVCGERPDLTTITLNSSPYAVPFYLRLGFRINGDELDQEGLICTPMEFSLKQDRDLLFSG